MRFFFLLFAAALCFTSKAQSTYVPLNEDYYHWVDRYEIKSGRIFPQLFTTVKPYKRAAIADWVDSLYQSGVFTSRSDQFNYDFLRNDNWEFANPETNDSRRPIFRHFYRKKSDLYHVDTEEFDLHVNPVLHVGLGTDSRRDERLFINTRGVEVRGMVDRKVGFYTFITENQMILPSYVWDGMLLNPVVPHEGFWKEYSNGQGVDFLHARGYISFEATRSINLQFGHDRLFVGNGHRSLIFSDFAPPSLFLKSNVKVWKLNYVFMINRMTADVEGSRGGLRGADQKYPEKYVAFHHLSLNIGKKFNLGLFESVVFSPRDSINYGSFEMAYLNPIIFHRAIEQQNGSADNVILGADFKWNVVKNVSLYGQFVLDEFVIENIRAGNGWWANKFAIQAGVKYVDALGVSNLDLQAEANVVRPYTYSHSTAYGSYSNYRQPIAHPLGANFTEMIGILRYQPIPRLNLTGKLMMIKIGRDEEDVNWGSDILRSNRIRPRTFGNTIGQGVQNDIVYGSFTASWQLRNNLFIDAHQIIRKSTSPDPFYNNDTRMSTLALRWNIAQRLHEF